MECLVFDTNVATCWQRVKEFAESCNEEQFWGDIKRHIRGFLKDMIEIGIEEEISSYIGIERYKHSAERQDYRNGYCVKAVKKLILTAYGVTTMRNSFLPS